MPARASRTIALFTDFGGDDLYAGQVKAALAQHGASLARVIDLLHRVPSHDARAGAHLLDALQRRFPVGTVFLAVVDPRVGTERDAAIVEADGKWYVGPDNGLLSVVAARAGGACSWRIVWRPASLSASFHGRDLFAPIAASLACGDFPLERTEPTRSLQVLLDAGDFSQVIYVDHYGNAMTGLRAREIPPRATLAVRGQRLAHARTFGEVAAGEAFWYENSIGLVEIAVNRASAAAALGLGVGDRVELGCAR